MDPVVLAVAAVAFLAAGTVKGVIGLGLPLTSVAILSTVLDLREALPLIVVPVIATNVWQAAQGGRIGALFARYWMMNAAVTVGTWSGTVLLFALNPGILQVLLAAVICGYALMNLSGIRKSLPARTERPLAPVVGLLSGLLAGTTGSVGVPVAIFLDALGLDKDTFVRAIALSFLISAVILGAGLVQQGGMGAAQALISCASLAPAFAGMYLGRRLRGRLSEERFRTWLMVFLLILAANLLRKALL